MIPVGATLRVMWVVPDTLYIDHREHNRPMDRNHLADVMYRLDEHPELSTDPVLVELRNGQMWVTNGRHRVLAHQLVGRDRIACIVTGVVDDSR